MNWSEAMAISDVPPPNGPRVLLDGQLQIGNMAVPVLVSASNHRLIIMSSEFLHRMAAGQTGVLSATGRENLRIVIEDIDVLSMIARYQLEGFTPEVQPELELEPAQMPGPEPELELPDLGDRD
jgi:hypothetical protein